MSEVKREVWVLETALTQRPQKAALTPRGVRPWLPSQRVTRYVPAESAQPAERAGEWVSVEDRLPEQAQRVLFWAAHWERKWPMSGIWDGQMGWFLGDDGCRCKTIGSTILWQPLPSSPQGDYDTKRAALAKALEP